MRIRISRGRAVDCRAVLSLKMSAGVVWGQLREFHRFARQDLFHAKIEIAGEVATAGAAITLSHRFLGFSVQRVGRILVWREGVGFSFSDISRRGARNGFPHVFGYRIESTGDSSCHLEIRVRGLWTARWVPRMLARLWLLWVFWQAVAHARREFLAVEIWREKLSQTKAHG